MDRRTKGNEEIVVKQRQRAMVLVLPPHWKFLKHWPVPLLPGSSAIVGGGRGAGDSDHWVCLGTQRPPSSPPTGMAESGQLWRSGLWNSALLGLLCYCLTTSYPLTNQL